MSTPPDLQAMNRVADPLADRAAAAIIGPWKAGAGPDLNRLARATRWMAQWRDNASLANWQPEDASADPALATLLHDYLAEGSTLPAWTNAAQIAQAEAVFMQEGPLSCTLLFCASLPECYVPPQLAEVLHVAGQLEAHTEHRIRQTAAMVFPVMLKGGLTDGAGCGVAQVLKVRLIHATIRHLILHGAPEHANGVIATGSPATASLHEALMAHGWDVPQRGLPCNQLELAYTLLTFSYVFLRGMRSMDQGLTSADETAFLHTWNVVGHVLGVRDDLMARSYDEAGQLFDRMRAAAGKSAPHPDPRPALGQALMTAMARSIRLPVIRAIPVPMTQWLIGAPSSRAIGIDHAATWPVRALFALGRALTQGVDQAARLIFPGFSLSRMFTRVIGYHMLSRFLLDQTRPLTLPKQVLNPMQDAIASWHHEPRAPHWVNRLEDALTVKGPWVATVGPKAK